VRRGLVVRAEVVDAREPQRVSCSGAPVLHADGTMAGCTQDGSDGCPGLHIPHDGDWVPCFVWAADGGCEHCGVSPVSSPAR
jgi:hypothetical protein